MRFLDHRGQNTVEYAVLFALVVAAFLTMQTYAKRGLQARVRSGTDALTSISGTIGGTTAAGATTGGVTFSNAVTQYEPYYQESFGYTYQETVEQEHVGGGQIKKEKVSDVTVRGKGAFQAQTGTGVRATKDALWETTTAPAPPPPGKK